MAERTLIAQVRPDTEEPETLLVTSPAVGVADGAPPKGVFLNPFDKLLTMKILNERFTLRLPRDVQGRVVEVHVPNAHTPLAFGEVLIRLDPRALHAETGPAGKAAGAGGGDAEGIEGDLIKVTAPSEGIFYRRPGPDAAPYVDVGAKITTGNVLGLVEVMKCFNQITYGGPGLPEKGEIVKVLAGDSVEVEFGQELFWIKPLA